MEIITTIVEMVKGTPWYVFGIFAYLMFIGIKSTKSYTVSIFTMSIMPFTLLVWLGKSVLNYPSPLKVFYFFIGAFYIGIILGNFYLYQKAIVNRKAKTATFEGTWILLPLFMSIFVIKYAFGYMYAIQHPFILAYPWAELAVSSCVTGILIGRLIKVYFAFLGIKK